MRYYMLDADGEPTRAPDSRVWALWFDCADRRIALDRISGVAVSTVFLGIDHFSGEEPPLLYETLVFGGPLDGEMLRTPTRADALRAHASTLARVLAQPEASR